MCHAPILAVRPSSRTRGLAWSEMFQRAPIRHPEVLMAPDTSTRRRRRIARRCAPVAAVALALAGCSVNAASPSTPSVGAPPSSEGASAGPAGPRDVVTGLAAPWSAVRVGDSTLVSERDTARILEFVPGGDIRQVMRVQGVVTGGEGGLLGLAVSPDGAALYVYSTAADGNRVERYGLDGIPGGLTLGAAETIIDELPKAGVHNGGRIAFGPDGALYITTGDAGVPGAAQDPENLGGKILRLTGEGDVPEDNPTPGSPVYSRGHRNVQGLDWGPDGRMFASEFGQDAIDELNVIEPGANYGWPEVEGMGGEPEFVDPVQQWPTDAASPSGLAVIGEMIYIANLRGRVLRAIPLDDLGTSNEYVAGEYGRLRDVLEGPDRQVWFVTNNTDGRGDPGPGDDRVVAVDPAWLGS